MKNPDKVVVIASVALGIASLGFIQRPVQTQAAVKANVTDMAEGRTFTITAIDVDDADRSPGDVELVVAHQVKGLRHVPALLPVVVERQDLADAEVRVADERADVAFERDVLADAHKHVDDARVLADGPAALGAHPRVHGRVVPLPAAHATRGSG